MNVSENRQDSDQSSSVLSCSVVIRAYNEEEHIGRLLTGIIEQTLEDVEIILVDSGSKDATVAIAQRFPVKIIHIHPDEFTFGYSLNCGIAASKGEFIAIASAHVYPVYPDWLERLLAPLKDPKVALSYGKQRGAASSHFSENQVFAQWFPNTPDSRQRHPFCNNANAAIRRSLWKQHTYDESLTGLEDIAWAKWAIDQGYTIAYVPEAEIIHVHNESPQQVYNRYRREGMGFKRIFPDENFSLWDFLHLYTTNVASDLWHALQEKALRSNFSSIFRFRLMQFWGTYRGYREGGPVTSRLRQTFYYPRELRSKGKKNKRNIEPIQYNEPTDVS